jgi:hypothetical protein
MSDAASARDRDQILGKCSGKHLSNPARCSRQENGTSSTVGYRLRDDIAALSDLRRHLLVGGSWQVSRRRET